MDYLGHRTSPDKLNAASKFQDAIQEALPSRNVLKLSSFLGAMFIAAHAKLRANCRSVEQEAHEGRAEPQTFRKITDD